jgi:hypothetical protein
MLVRELSKQDMASGAPPSRSPTNECRSWTIRATEQSLGSSWYSEVPNTIRNRSLAYDWLMQHCIQFI